MSFLTDAIYDTVLDYFWGGDTADLPAPPGTWYVALFVTMPDPDGTGGVEASFTSYARVAVTNDLTNWPAAAASLKHNGSLLDYGTAGSGPSTVEGFGFYDDPTAGALWAAIDLTGAPVTINNGAAVTFPIGAIDLTNCL